MSTFACPTNACLLSTTSSVPSPPLPPSISDIARPKYNAPLQTQSALSLFSLSCHNKIRYDTMAISDTTAGLTKSTKARRQTEGRFKNGVRLRAERGVNKEGEEYDAEAKLRLQPVWDRLLNRSTPRRQSFVASLSQQRTAKLVTEREEGKLRDKCMLRRE